MIVENLYAKENPERILELGPKLAEIFAESDKWFMDHAGRESSPMYSTGDVMKVFMDDVRFLAATEGDVIMGTCCLSAWGQEGFVCKLYVRPEARKQGVGRALMHAAREHYRDMGCENVVLECVNTNEEAMEFYYHLGFASRSNLMSMSLTDE